MIAFAAIAPHGDVDSTPELLAAMQELGRRCSADVAIVVTPHNVHVEGHFAIDWGTEVPLRFLRTERVVVVAPARDRPLEEHVRLGETIAAATGDRRIALIASADHGHAHDPDGPYGFDEAAAAYDARFLELLGSDPLDFTPLAELVEPAKADSLWQLLVLQGAVSRRAELLAYAAPTYYGMAVAVVGEA